MEEEARLAVVDLLITRARTTAREPMDAETDVEEIDVEKGLRALYRRMGIDHEPAPIDQTSADAR